MQIFPGILLSIYRSHIMTLAENVVSLSNYKIRCFALCLFQWLWTVSPGRSTVSNTAKLRSQLPGKLGTSVWATPHYCVPPVTAPGLRASSRRQSSSFWAGLKAQFTLHHSEHKQWKGLQLTFRSLRTGGSTFVLSNVHITHPYRMLPLIKYSPSLRSQKWCLTGYKL